MYFSPIGGSVFGFITPYCQIIGRSAAQLGSADCRFEFSIEIIFLAIDAKIFQVNTPVIYSARRLAYDKQLLDAIPFQRNADKSLFIKQMLDVMRKTVKKEGLLGGGMSEEIFTDMLYDEYAKKMAETAQFGLAQTIYDQVSSKL